MTSIVASRPKKNGANQYQPLPSSDEDDSSSSEQYQIDRSLLRKVEKEKVSTLTSYLPSFQFKGRGQDPLTAPSSLVIHQAPRPNAQIEKNTSGSGESVAAAATKPKVIMCYQKYGSEKPDGDMHDDTFPTSMQNTRDHSSEPIMVNGIQFSNLFNENATTQEANHGSHFAIPQHVKQDHVSSRLVTPKWWLPILHYKNKEGILQKPHSFKFEVIRLLGDFMNALVTHLVNIGRIEFRLPSTVCQSQCEKQVTVLEKRPVNNPSDRKIFPRAFNAWYTLGHVNDNLPIYSPFLGFRDTNSLKEAIAKVAKEIPEFWETICSTSDWDSVITFMTIVRDFMEQVASGVESSGSPDLVESLRKICNEIDDAKQVCLLITEP